MSVNSCNPSYADSLYLIVHCLTRHHPVLPCYVSTCFMPVLCNEPPIKIFQINVWIHDLLQRVGRSEFVSYRRCWMWSRPYGLCQERTNMQENCKEFRPQSMPELSKVQLSVNQLKKSLETIGDFVCNMIWMCNKFLSFRRFIVQCSNDHRIVDLFGRFPYWYHEPPLPRPLDVLVVFESIDFWGPEVPKIPLFHFSGEIQLMIFNSIYIYMYIVYVYNICINIYIYIYL